MALCFKLFDNLIQNDDFFRFAYKRKTDLLEARSNLLESLRNYIKLKETFSDIFVNECENRYEINLNDSRMIYGIIQKTIKNKEFLYRIPFGCNERIKFSANCFLLVRKLLQKLLDEPETILPFQRDQINSHDVDDIVNFGKKFCNFFFFFL